MSNPNSFIIDEVISQLSDDTKSLSSPLLKLSVFARYIKNDELMSFVNSEINGYNHGQIIPEYRKIGANLELDLQAGYNIHKRDFLISILPSPWNKIFAYIHIMEGVPVIEGMLNLKSSDLKDQIIYHEIPKEIIYGFSDIVSKVVRSDVRVIPIGGRLLGNGNKLPQILANIRSKLIDLCFAIAEQFGHEINLLQLKSNESRTQEIIYNIMSNTISNHGDGNIINTGKASTIHATISINKGSVEDLQSSLNALNIEEDDILEITKIVQSELPNPATKRLGNQAIDWITKITGKALKGIGSITTNVSSDILGNIISQYYGL